MPEFYYKAVSREGVADEGLMTATSSQAVVQRLQEQGYIPILANEIDPPKKLLPSMRLPKLLRQSEKPNITALTLALASLTSAGMSLDRALEIIQEVETHDATRTLAADIQSSVRGGDSLSQALEAQGTLFSTFHVSMVHAAEISGTLADGLERVADYLERTRELRDKVVSALIYPAILAFVAGLSVAILLLFVVPQFRSVFEEMGSALPLATRVVLSVSDFIAAWGWLALLVAIGAGIWARHVWAREETRRRVDRIVLSTPIVGDLVRNLETAKLARTLGTMLQNGVPLLTGLSVAEKTLSNHIMSDAVSAASVNLREGGDLSRTFHESGQFPGLAIQMIKVGEETGHLDRMMLKVCDVYDREVDLATRRVLALLEPVMIVTLGVLIAGIIMSILVGIISINDLPL